MGGTINGRTANAHFAAIVTPRNWSTVVTVKDHSIPSPSELSSHPTAFEGQLGLTTLTLPFDPVAAHWAAVVSDGGPNDGFQYLVGLPVITTTISVINTNALSVSSDFYNRQEITQVTILGVTWCGQSFVTAFIPLVQAHEGTDPDHQPNSHAAIFRHDVDSMAAPRLESFAGPLSRMIAPITDDIFGAASDDSFDMDFDSRNNLTSVTVPCHFHYF